MKMISIWIAVLWVKGVLSVDYNELETMGVACNPRDTCRRSSHDFLYTNCECDRSCLLYDDCCVNGPKRTRRSPKKLEGLTCIPVLPNQGVYGVSTCSNTWNGPADVKNKCENLKDLSDPLMSVPVTQTEKRVTYRNLNCAICNAASTTGLTFWNLRITCNSLSKAGYNDITEKYIMENIVRDHNTWGVYHWNEKVGNTSFYPCNLWFPIPRSAENSIRYCRPNVVSSCAPNWNRETVRKDCESYMGVVYIKKQAYRNAHCALCNHVFLQNVNCFPEAEGEIATTGLSWTIVLDISRNNNKCSTEQVYNSYVKKCRRLICTRPGDVPRNGECVQH